MPEAELRLADVYSVILDAPIEDDKLKADPMHVLSGIEYALQGQPPHGEEPEDFEARRQGILTEHADYFALPIDNRPTIDCELEDRHGMGLTTISTTHIPRPGDLISLAAIHVEGVEKADWRVRLVKWVEVPGPGRNRGPFMPRLIVERELGGG